MSRAIVLIICLVTAGAIAAYSNDARDRAETGDKVKVYIVPARTDPPAVIPAVSLPSPPTATDVPTDKAALTRALQRELKRVGCYSGDINGVWTTSSRLAMKAFVDHANASLPIHSPDAVLLSLVRSHPAGVCAAPCPPGRVCEPIEASPAPTQEQARGAGTATAVTAAAAASAAVAATAVAPKPAEKVAAVPDTAAKQPPADAGEPRADNRKVARDRKTRRSWKDPAKPPRFVRDFLRTVERGFKLP
jgi:hypothetical protein